MKYPLPRTVLDATVWLISSAFLAVLLASQADAATPPASPGTGAAATWRDSVISDLAVHSGNVAATAASGGGTRTRLSTR